MPHRGLAYTEAGRSVERTTASGRRQAATRPRRRPRHDGLEPRPRLPGDRRFRARRLVHAQCGASRHDLDQEFAGLPRYEGLTEALRALSPTRSRFAPIPSITRRWRLKRSRRARTFSAKSRSRTRSRPRERIVAAARKANKALLVGYILRVHPSWMRFVEIGRTLGKPLVMRMNLNQQSSGSFWQVHKNLMRSTSPIVDCGVHYVDVMCQVTRARPVAVHAVGARLTDEIAPTMSTTAIFTSSSMTVRSAGTRRARVR